MDMTDVMDFQKARRNMVDSQIHTAGVVLPGLLKSFEDVPRERFVPRGLQGIACNDDEIPLGGGRFLLEPMVQARMIQALEPRADHVVLDVGGGTGYAAAVLAPLVSTVVAVEENEAMLDHALKTWLALDCFNIVGLKGSLTGGNPENAPYHAVLLNGAVETVPPALLEQLAPGGKLVAVVRPAGRVMGAATLFHNAGEGRFPSLRLFDAAAHYLPGFEPSPGFRF